MTGFQIQVQSIQWDIWVKPEDPFRQAPKLVSSTSVEELRDSIRQAADERTLSFAQHVRIVTDDGAPVERWKITPGVAKRLRRRY